MSGLQYLVIAAPFLVFFFVLVPLMVGVRYK